MKRRAVHADKRRASIRAFPMSSLRNDIVLEGALNGARPAKIWLRHIRRFGWIYAFGALSVIGTNITESVVPKIVQHAIDGVSKGDLDVARLVAFFALVLVVQAVCRVLWRVTLGRQTHEVSAKMRSLLWNRVRFLPKERLETDLSPGEIMNVAAGDAQTARFIFGFTLVGTIDFIFLIIFNLFFMLTIDVELTMWALVVVPVLPVIMDRLARKESRQHDEAQSSLSNLTDLATQAVGSVRLQRLTRTSAFWIGRLTESARDYRNKRFEVQKTALSFIPVTGVAPLLSLAVLIVLGSRKVLAGEMTIGAFVAMQSYVLLIQGPLIELGTIISEWQRSFTSFRRVADLWHAAEAPLLRTGGEATAKATDPVYEVRDLRFAYPGRERPVIEGLSFRIESGERVGIMGPIGAGKSTLLQILAGLERGYEGRVDLRGREIREYAHAHLRSVIKVVPQKTFLFADTIRANLSLDREMSDEEIWHYLDIAGISEDARGFPKGLDTPLGEWGLNLSGGQKQRLTIARALAAKPEVLLLDDCLSAVDTVTEERILRNLDRELKHCTLLWVAHRDSTLRYCHRLIRLEGVEATA